MSFIFMVFHAFFFDHLCDRHKECKGVRFDTIPRLPWKRFLSTILCAEADPTTCATTTPSFVEVDLGRCCSRRTKFNEARSSLPSIDTLHPRFDPKPFRKELEDVPPFHPSSKIEAILPRAAFATSFLSELQDRRNDIVRYDTRAASSLHFESFAYESMNEERFQERTS